MTVLKAAPSRWTTEINQEVRRLWAIGTSALEISKIIGQTHRVSFSRCAIIGRCQRMGWRTPNKHEHKTSCPWPRIPRVARRPKNKDGSIASSLKSRQKRPSITKDTRPLADVFPVGSRNMKLLDLGRHDCRYPTSPDDATTHLFCGLAQIEGSPYCATHHALCWRSSNRNSKLGVQLRSSTPPLTDGARDAGTGGPPVPPPTNLPHNKTRSEHSGTSC